MFETADVPESRSGTVPAKTNFQLKTRFGTARERPTFRPPAATDRPSSNLGRETQKVNLDHTHIVEWGEEFRIAIIY